MNAPERFATLKSQPAPSHPISIVNQPFLGNALARDETHEKGLANGVCGVKDRVDFGYRHRC